MNLLYIVGGAMALALGVVGVFLPLLPTVPFVLLAAFCFSRGSPGLHKWLRQTKIFGGMISDWEQKKVIRRSTKIKATIMIVLSGAASFLFFSIPKVGLVTMILFFSAVLIVIWKQKEKEAG